MAKVGFWLQGAKGKLAGSALQKGVNGTVIRQITQPKNPKTANQVLQRVLVNTVSQAYSALRTIACHSFQGKTEGAQCMAEFQKQNLSYFRQRAASVPEEQLSAFVNFVPVGQKGIRPARFIMSEGTLPRVPMAITPSTYHAVLSLSANTYAAVINDYDLKRGDQLTFVVIEESSAQAGEYIAKYARVILDPRDAEGNEAPLSSTFIANNAINLPNSKNEGNFGLLTFTEGTGVEFSMKNGATTCAVGCIVSRLDGEEWKRSNCQLVVSEGAIGEYGISLARAIQVSRERTSIYMTDANQYLDNAGVSGGQSTNSGSGSSEEEASSVATINNSVRFNNASQNVSGGSVNVTEPLSTIVVTGTNLQEGNVIVTSTGPVREHTVEVNAAKTQLTITFAEPLVAGDVQDINKRPDLDVRAEAWFTINVVAAQGGGSLDEG